MTDKILVCSRCQVQPELVKEEGRPDLVRCPSCDNSGDLDEVMRRAAEYVYCDNTDESIEHVIRTIPPSKSVRYIKNDSSQTSTHDSSFSEPESLVASTISSLASNFVYNSLSI